MAFQLGSRVLIVDADADVRRRLFNKLLQHEIFSDVVATSSDAIAKLRERAYLFVLLDVTLADDGARNVLRRITALPPNERPIIVATAHNVESARGLDVELVQVVLRKPLDIPNLADLIRVCVRPTSERPPHEHEDHDRRDRIEN
ncbi:MAG TPA: response regulator [Thermoanaerobaculia bacterium]|nr:response regulator [Thermoanaerobaculia bacterium]